MAALIIFGAIGLSRLGVSEQPDVDFPVLTINATWGGAAPEVMETEVVDKIEEEVISTQGLRDVSSQIQQGQASITLEFNIDRNIDAALTEVQSKLSAVELPLGADQPTIIKTNPEDQPIVLLSASSTTRDLHALTEFLELNVVDQLKILPGVGEVTLAGYQQRNLRVWVDNDKLKALQLTILDVKSALESEQVEEAAGYLENSSNEFNVRTMGEGATPDAVGALRIKKRGGETIYNSNIRIRDVARVEDGLEDVRHMAIVNGKPGIGIGIKKQHGANSVAVAQVVKDRLVELRKSLPPDVKIDVNFDSSIFIQDAIHETEFTLLLSAIITSIVCFLFLGSWSSTVNVLLSIPTSVMGTFMVLYFMGFTLNFFTLLGLSLAIGIIVDDAIMVLENIVRHLEMKKSKVLAARDGAREITFAALAATIAVVAIFLPVAFMSGIIGRFFFQFGITISAAVLLSLVEAITVTPMRCSQFMGDADNRYARWAGRQFEWLSFIYRDVLAFCLSHRLLVITISTIIFLVSLTLAYTLPKGIPAAAGSGRISHPCPNAGAVIDHLHARQAGGDGNDPAATSRDRSLLLRHWRIHHGFRRGRRRSDRWPSQQRADLCHAQAEIAARNWPIYFDGSVASRICEDSGPARRAARPRLARFHRGAGISHRAEPARTRLSCARAKIAGDHPAHAAERQFPRHRHRFSYRHARGSHLS